jgi:hypothetical protein
MSDDPFRALRLQASDGVAHVTIDHPPVNLLDATLLEDLDRLSHTLASVRRPPRESDRRVPSTRDRPRQGGRQCR